MKKILSVKLIGLVPVALAAGTLFYQVKPPEWRTVTLDTEHPRRFVDMALYRGEPFVVYFNEQDGGGVLYQMAKTSRIAVVEDLKRYFEKSQRDWVSGVVDQDKNTGLFISAAADDRKVHLAYQDGTLGKERLVYAVYDGREWRKEVVDDAESGGINVGMYASITVVGGEPVIFYHTEQGRKFSYAKHKNGSWDKKLIGTGVGWMTSSETCGNKTQVAYRQRDEQGILLGLLEGNSWSTRPVEASTASSLALTTRGCQPYLAYFDDAREEVEFFDPGQGRALPIGEGKNSRVSLAANQDGFHAAYFLGRIHEGELIYAFSRDGQVWESRMIDHGQRAGWYNAIETDGGGDIYLAYTDDNSLRFAEYNVSAGEAVKKAKISVAGLLSAAGLLLFLFL